MQIEKQKCWEQGKGLKTETLRWGKVRKADKKGKVGPFSLSQILRKLPPTLT